MLRTEHREARVEAGEATEEVTAAPGRGQGRLWREGRPESAHRSQTGGGCERRRPARLTPRPLTSANGAMDLPVRETGEFWGAGEENQEFALGHVVSGA